MRTKSQNKRLAVLYIVLSTFLIALSQYLLKKGAIFVDLNNLLTFIQPFLIFGVICYFIAALLMVLAIQRSELSMIYPMISLSFVWVIWFAFLFLGENIAIFNWLGVLFILAGIFFLGGGR